VIIYCQRKTLKSPVQPLVYYSKSRPARPEKLYKKKPRPGNKMPRLKKPGPTVYFILKARPLQVFSA